MKTYIYIPQKMKALPLLRQHLTAFAQMDITEKLSEADVAIIFGVFSWSSARFARRCRRMGIPYVVSPWGQMSRWNVEHHLLRSALRYASYQRSVNRNAFAMIATTPMEQKYLKSKKSQGNVELIRNSMFSTLITKEQMLRQHSALLSKALDDYETRLSERIAKTTEGNAICYQLMKIQHRIAHEDIPLTYLQELNDMLYADNYDEDELNARMQKLKIDKFAASVFYVMSLKTQLTEGFMPCPSRHDSKAKQILKLIDENK